MFIIYILSNRWLKNKYIFPNAVPVQFSCSAVSLLEIYLDEIRGQMHTSQRAAQTLEKDVGMSIQLTPLTLTHVCRAQVGVPEAGGQPWDIGYPEAFKALESPFGSHTYTEQSDCFQSFNYTLKYLFQVWYFFFMHLSQTSLQITKSLYSCCLDLNSLKTNLF